MWLLSAIILSSVMADAKTSVVEGVPMELDDQVPCCGLRIDPASSNAAAFNELCNCTRKAMGQAIDIDYIWNVFFAGTPAAYGCSLRDYQIQYPKEHAALVAKAAELQDTHHGRYVGRVTHLESVLCVPSGGSRVLGGACKACYLLGYDRTITKRVARRNATDGDAPSRFTNRSVQSTKDSDQLASIRIEEHKRDSKRIRTLEGALSRAKERFEAAMSRLAQFFVSDAQEQEAAHGLEREEWAARLAECQKQQQRRIDEAIAEWQRWEQAAAERQRRTISANHQIEMCQMQNHSHSQMVLQAARHDAEMAQMEARHSVELTRVRLEHHHETNRLPQYIQDLMRAERNGNASAHPHCIDIIKGMASCLSNGTTKGRKLNDTERHLYGILMNSGSPWAQKFVSGNLLGPHLRTMQRDRARYMRPIGLDFTEAAVATLKMQLLDYDLLECPGTICEDATTCNRRLDWEVVLQRLEDRAPTDSPGWKRGVTIWGLTGGPEVVHSLEQLQKLFDDRKHEVARYVYVYTWVPVAQHAPWFPFILIATDNRFNATWVWERWRKLHKLCADAGLRLVAHASDGDSRLRLTDYILNLYENRSLNGDWYRSSYTIDHPLFIIHLPTTKEGLTLLACQDLVHLLWRWRRQMLDDKKTLQIAGHLIKASYLADIPWITRKVREPHACGEEGWGAATRGVSRHMGHCAHPHHEGCPQPQFQPVKSTWGGRGTVYGVKDATGMGARGGSNACALTRGATGPRCARQAELARRDAHLLGAHVRVPAQEDP